MMRSDTREDFEIIGLQKSECETYIAVVSGKNLIMDEQYQSKLFIFKKNQAPGKKSYCSLFKLHKSIVLEKIPIFVKVCMQFIFKKEINVHTMIFSNKECIFEMDFESEEIQVLYHFSKPFSI